MTTRKFLTFLALPLAFLCVGLGGNEAHASSFNAGKIIDDVIFTNNSSMSASQVQAFLNSKVPTCDTNGTMPASDFGRPDLTHAQYAAMRGWPGPPYTCLKDYVENGTTAAQLIYNLSQQYKINPQVFIVTLQKESSLVTDIWPLSSQYRTATGYGCPDSGPGGAFQFVAALGVAITSERVGSLAGDALTYQGVHVADGSVTKPARPLPIHQQAIQLAAGDDAQAQVQPGLGALLDVTDDLHLRPPRP